MKKLPMAILLIAAGVTILAGGASALSQFQSLVLKFLAFCSQWVQVLDLATLAIIFSLICLLVAFLGYYLGKKSSGDRTTKN